MKSLMVLSFLVASCSGPSSSNNIGYHVSDKPLRGTREFNRDYVRPYWQCTDKIINISCDGNFK